MSLVLAPAAVAQTTRAYSAPKLPCNSVAPAHSLVADSAEPAVFLPDSRNAFVIEIERAPRSDSWVAETTHPGFTGASYYRWAGPNLYSSPGRGVLTYRVMVPQGARYQIALHNRHNHPDSSMENDCWVRANGSGWTKLYSNTGSNSNVWGFHSRFDPGHGYAQYQLNAGLNVIELSARSANFMIDRLHLFPVGTSGYESLNVGLSQSENSRPMIGSRYRARIGDPTDAAGLTPGGTAAIWMLSPIEPSTDCGTAVPGFGQGNAAGELMLDLSASPVMVGPIVWGGPTSPARVSLDVPSDPQLVGTKLFTQALLFDAVRLDAVLTPRLELRIGDV